MTTLTRNQISEIVGNDPRKIQAYEQMQKGVQALQGTALAGIAATVLIQDATVLTLSPNDAFNNERVIEQGQGISLFDTGPNGNLIIATTYNISTNGGYSLTFNLAADTNVDLPSVGRILESTLGGGPYANDAAAAAAGIKVGEIYRAPSGAVVWRQV